MSYSYNYVKFFTKQTYIKLYFHTKTPAFEYLGDMAENYKFQKLFISNNTNKNTTNYNKMLLSETFSANRQLINTIHYGFFYLKKAKNQNENEIMYNKT